MAASASRADAVCACIKGWPAHAARKFTLRIGVNLQRDGDERA
jgi:hypothetical protein